MKTITIHTGEPYRVLVGHNLIGSCGQLVKTLFPGNRVLLITDSNVGPLYAERTLSTLRSAGLTAQAYPVPAGEGAKSLSVAEGLYTFLIEHGYTRGDLLLALGGGVVTDLTGFVAATYQRGVAFAGIATSLLAQVDASVGGKTAVNIPAGKNLVGCFWQPKLVLCDLDTLSTLPEREFSGGMAEVIKYGAIQSEELFQRCAAGVGPGDMEEVVSACVELKNQVVSVDERDMGARAVLNFGHTLGHGIEKLGGFSLHSHGESVAMGMVLASDAFERMGDTAPGTTARLVSCLSRYGLPTQCPYPIHEVLQECTKDKKRTGDSINFVVVPKIGTAKTKLVPIDALNAYFRKEQA